MKPYPPLAALLVAWLAFAGSATGQEPDQPETTPAEAVAAEELGQESPEGDRAEDAESETGEPEENGPGDSETEKELPATLRITTDLPCRLTVGGKVQDPLEAGEKREVAVELGSVTVRADSLETARAVWEEEIEVEKPGTVKVRIRMEKALREERQRERREEVFRNPKKGLMWSLRDNGQDIDWERAVSYCEDYRLGGFEDWRLPTLAELETLQAIWSRAQFKALGGVMLTACCAWSSDREDPNRAWNFNFRFRKEFAVNRVFTYDLRALCVRDWSEEEEPEAADKVPSIAQAHGLTVVEQLDAAAPEVVLVASQGTIPDEQVVEQVLEEEDVVGFERLHLTAITESAAGADLDQSYTVIVETLTTGGEHQGDLASNFSAPLWEGFASQPLVNLVNLHAAHAHKDADNEDAAPFGSGLVAVIDTGVDPDHPLLAGALVPGYDFILDQPGIPSEWSNLDPASAAAVRQDLETVADQSYTVIVENQPLTPAFGHGTMVAGIIRLVAPGAQIMPIRVFDGAGSADLFEIARAIRWAVDNGADVINMSFSTEQTSLELMRAVNYAYRNGVVCVASVGNRGERTGTFPASYGLALGVAASTAGDSLSSFSNRGSDLVALAAPGEGVITLYPGGGFAASWGTSFSTALVSGTVALLHQMEQKGNQPPVFKPTDQHRAAWALKQGAFDPAGSEEWGSGRLDILEAMKHRVPAGKMVG